MGNYQIISAIFWREGKTRVRYKLELATMVIRPMVAMLPFLLFTQYMFDNNSFQSNMDWDDYRMYLVLSAITVNFVSNTISDSVTAIVEQIQQGTLETMAVMPIRLEAVWGVELLFSALMQLATAGLIFAVYAFFGGLPVSIGHPAVFAFAVACAICLNIGIGVLLSGVTLKTKMAKMAYMLISFLMFTAGEMYPVTVFPKALQVVAYCNPLTYLLDVARYSVLGTDTYLPLEIELLCLLALGAAFMALSLLQCRLLLRKLKRDGTLTQY